MDGIDIGDIETRFKIDLSGLREATEQAKAMMSKIPGLDVDDSKAKKGMEGVSQSATKMQENVGKESGKMANDVIQNAKKMSDQLKGQMNIASDAGVKSFGQLRTSASKDVDSLVRDIEQKMGQARAAMLKMQSLTAKRSAGRSSGAAPANLLQMDSQIASAQAQMQKYQNMAKDLAQSMSRELDAVPDSFAKIEKSMASNEGEINRLQAKLKALRASYAQQQVPISGDFSSGFKMGDNDESLKTKAQIDKLQGSVEKLIAENDDLAKSYAKIEDRSAQLKSALSGVNTELKEQASASKRAGSGLSSIGKFASAGGGFFKKLRDSAGNFFNRFKSGGSEVTSGSSRMESALGGITRSLKMVGAQVFLFTLLGQGLTSLIGWLWSAANTNSQFAASFNQVYVNLLTAFYPIYTAVMPALNAFMAGLAKATGVMASFIANLFGTTYSQAKQGAAGLQSSIQKLNSTASSGSGVSKAASTTKKLADNTADATKKAKELQQSLASFDEINTLTKQSSTDASAVKTPAATKTPNVAGADLGGADFGAAMGNYSTPKWMLDLAADVANIAKRLWAPVAEAWDKVGDTVIKSFKYALGEMLGLGEAIGKSFMSVWENGTGEKFVENLLKLLSDVLNIIGDIAKAFKDAWNDDGRGTKLIQTIFDSFNSILELLHEIATAFEDAWNSGVGEQIAGNILEIITNIFAYIGNIADAWKNAFKANNNGQKIFKDILGMVNDLLGAINDMTKAASDWAKGLNLEPLASSFEELLAAVKPLAKDVWDGLAWAFKNVILPIAGFVATYVLPDLLKIIASSLNMLSAAIDVLKPLFKFLWDNILAPLAAWTGGIIAAVLGAIADGLLAVSKWVKAHKDLGKDWNALWGGIGSFFGGVWDGMKGKFTSWGKSFGTWWSSTSSTVGKNWNGFWSKTGTTLKNTWDGAKKKTSEWGNNLSDWWGSTSSSVGKKWNGFWSSTGTKLKDTWTSAKTNTSKLFGDIADKTSTTWSGIKGKVSDYAGKAKDGAINAWTTMKSKTSPFFSSVAKTAQDAFGKISGWASGMGSKIGKGLSAGMKFVKSGAAAIANGIMGVIGGAVNGVIKGINWVLGKVGSSKKLGLWSVPKFATGGRHKGGPALVNDASGSVYQEAYRLPNGQTGLFPAQRNLLLNMPAGTQIMPANRVAQKMAAMIPHYAGGIFDMDFDLSSLSHLDFSGISKAFGSVSSTIGNVVGSVSGTIEKFLGNPKGLWNWVVDKYAGLTNKAGLGFNIASGAIGKMGSGAISMIKKALNSFVPATPSGSGVARWRSTVVKALSENGLSTSSAMVNKVLRQIQTESGGNQLAIQGNIGDINNRTGDLAKGLMQTITATFNANKFPGHGNIFNGYDNLLAALNYAKRRYGPSLSYLGQGHGYANGGLIDKDGMYRVGENDKSEMVIPLTKPARALELMQDALKYMDLSTSELTLPGVASEPDIASGLSAGGSGTSTTGLSGFSLADLTAAFANALAGADLGGEGDTTVNAEMKVDQDTLAQIVIKAINARTRKVGRTELII